jgi:hypothetical protein
VSLALRPISEKAFLAQVRQLAHLLGWLCYHTHDSRRSQPGFPDLTLVRGSRLLFAELKTDTGRVTAAQQQWLDALAAAGQEVYVWRPCDWAAIEAALR